MAAVQEGRVELGLLEKAPVRPSEEAREVVQVVVVVSERAEAVAAVQEGGAEVGVLDGAQVRGGSVSLGLGVGGCRMLCEGEVVILFWKDVRVHDLALWYSGLLNAVASHSE